MFKDEMNDEIEVQNEPTDQAPEDLELEEVEAADEENITKLRKNLKACQQEKREALEEMQRAKAEFLNARRRLDEANQIARERLDEAWVEELLPLCDSFCMAMSNKEAWEAVDKNWRIGVEGIYSQLKTILDRHQVAAINPVNETFDAERHEAVGTRPREEEETDQIVQVVQVGYERNGVIIRPAKVIITE